MPSLNPQVALSSASSCCNTHQEKPAPPKSFILFYLWAHLTQKFRICTKQPGLSIRLLVLNWHVLKRHFFLSLYKWKQSCKYISRATAYLRNGGWSQKPACQIHLVQVLRAVYFGNGTKASWDKAALLMWKNRNIPHYSQSSCQYEKWISFRSRSRKHEYFIMFQQRKVGLKKTWGSAYVWADSQG